MRVRRCCSRSYYRRNCCWRAIFRGAVVGDTKVDGEVIGGDFVGDTVKEFVASTVVIDSFVSDTVEYVVGGVVIDGAVDEDAVVGGNTARDTVVSCLHANSTVLGDAVG